ncbi:Casein kinase I [Penicillium subrubescens]|uniref:Casein kinase I n=1 Tax=Penicillium subrubescens TaxID=1316194 RepID=A0A1Q5UAL5_9EURO|nr:Casein kinase I [Penicillium subrubescens]
MSTPADAIGPFIVERWLHPKSTGIVSIKTERASSDLALEASALQALSGGIGFPTLYWFGTAFGKQVMITEEAGESLEVIFNQCDRHFDMQILLGFACQLIFRLEWMHSHHISHGNLSPSSFTVGPSPWQTLQITVSSFENADLSHFSARKDLEAVGNVLLYFATGSVSWDEFKASEQNATDFLPMLNGYYAAISSGVLNPADYGLLRCHFLAACQSLPKGSLLGGLSPLKKNLSLKELSGKTTGDLFDSLGEKMSVVGQRAGDVTSSWTQEQETYIIGALDEIMAIFMILLMRDRPSHSRQQHLMGAYHLPNRLWRDIRWYLRMASCGSVSFQRLITLRIYKFMGVLLEVIPLYNRYWTMYLSELAYAQTALDLESSSTWRQAWIYWKDRANFLNKRKWNDAAHGILG